MNRSLRPVVVAALAATGIVASTAVALANVEVGGTAGIHVFSSNNELGVSDVPAANSIRNSSLFGVRLGVYVGDIFGIEGELGVIPSEARDTVFDVWTLTYRGQLVAQFRADAPENQLIPFLLVGGGAFQIVDNGGSQNDPQIHSDTDLVLYAGLGAKFRVDNGWGLRLDARLLFPPSSKDTSFTYDFEALLSIYKEFGRDTPPKAEPKVVDNDPDKDGILGDADKCPTEAEDKDSFQDDDGCPDLDNDGDGIPDTADKCPCEALDMDGFLYDDGCPDPDNDGDGDGIPDTADKCPSEAEDKDGFQDDDGCPDPDNDGDGILDAVDKCPTEAEDKDGFQDDDGCPDPDNDGDGVLDATDKCPTEPETKNGYQDDDGCPDEIPAKLKQFTGVIQGINFKVGDAALQTTSNASLDKAVAVLKEFGDLKLEIQGHTDDQPLKPGSKFADNLALSQARADSVKAYFVDKGIDPARLTSKGYGDTVPVEDPKGLTGGKLNTARAKNRRVEFKLVSALTQ